MKRQIINHRDLPIVSYCGNFWRSAKSRAASAVFSGLNQTWPVSGSCLTLPGECGSAAARNAMKALEIDGQFGLDHLKLVDRPEPKPRFGEVVIRTLAVSLNYRDTDMVAGTYPFKFPLPLVPTSDGVGEVVAVGEGVTRAKAGDRVLGTFWQSWIGGDFDQTSGIGQLGGDIDGMRSEFVRLEEWRLVHATEHLTDVGAS